MVTARVSLARSAASVARVYAGDTSYEAEFAGLIFSLEALIAAKAPADQDQRHVF